MTPISADVANGILTQVGTVGNSLITSLGNLSGVFLTVAGVTLLMGILHSAISFRRN